MKRVVFLVDMNAFFISCEKTRHPEIEGKPAAVAGDPVYRTGIILTANYEARKYGIKTTMILREAFRLCPDLIIIPPDHSFYEKKSKEVMEILSSYSPLVEQNSIDEAWLDMTGCESLFGQPLQSARSIMDKIKNELNLWCSIGISENKFLAKMASEMKKPLGITELWKDDIEEKLWYRPVNFMYGVGKMTAKKLNDMGIYTIKDLALANRENIYKKLGKTGAELILLANGIDESPVEVNRDDMKSIGRSTTLPHDITDIEYAKEVLMELSDDIGMTARKSKKKGHTVQITIKYSDFNTITRQITISPTCNVKDIYAAGVNLLESNWSKEPVRLLGISLSGFIQNESQQISLFNLVDENEIKNDERIDNLEDTILKIREKYGTDIIKLSTPNKKE